MQKLSKETMEAALRKHILNCTEDEIRFVFHLLNFDLKEYKQEMGRITFEVHFTRFYIIKITVTPELLVFSNEWIVFNDDKTNHSLECATPPMFFSVLNMMMNFFGEALLKPTGWKPTYIEGYSIFEDGKEAKGYFDLFQKTADAIIKEIEALTPAEEGKEKAGKSGKKAPAKKAAPAKKSAKVIKLPMPNGKGKKLPN